jgi:hypothetical protein
VSYSAGDLIKDLLSYVGRVDGCEPGGLAYAMKRTIGDLAAEIVRLEEIEAMYEGLCD